MAEYICEKCGAVLDPGEKCWCEYSSATHTSSGKDSGKGGGYQFVRFEERDGKMYAITR